jgi:hypothetical protein
VGFPDKSSVFQIKRYSALFVFFEPHFAGIASMMKMAE